MSSSDEGENRKRKKQPINYRYLDNDPTWYQGKGCEVCGENQGDIFNCNKCPRKYHGTCSVPPLNRSTIEDDWRCLMCVSKEDIKRVPQAPIKKGTKGSGKMGQRELQICRKLLLEMLTRGESVSFWRIKDLDFKAYKKLIAKPIALDVIKEKLNPKSTRQYSVLHEMVEDLRRMFANCRQFWDGVKLGKTYLRHANYLEDHFDNQLKKWSQVVYLDSDPEPDHLPPTSQVVEKEIIIKHNGLPIGKQKIFTTVQSSKISKSEKGESSDDGEGDDLPLSKMTRPKRRSSEGEDPFNAHLIKKEDKEKEAEEREASENLITKLIGEMDAPTPNVEKSDDEEGTNAIQNEERPPSNKISRQKKIPPANLEDCDSLGELTGESLERALENFNASTQRTKAAEARRKRQKTNEEKVDTDKDTDTESPRAKKKRVQQSENKAKMNPKLKKNLNKDSFEASEPKKRKANNGSVKSRIVQNGNNENKYDDDKVANEIAGLYAAMADGGASKHNENVNAKIKIGGKNKKYSEPPELDKDDENDSADDDSKAPKDDPVDNLYKIKIVGRKDWRKRKMGDGKDNAEKNTKETIENKRESYEDINFKIMIPQSSDNDESNNSSGEYQISRSKSKRQVKLEKEITSDNDLFDALLQQSSNDNHEATIPGVSEFGEFLQSNNSVSKKDPAKPHKDIFDFDDDNEGIDNSGQSGGTDSGMSKLPLFGLDLGTFTDAVKATADDYKKKSDEALQQKQQPNESTENIGLANDVKKKKEEIDSGIGTDSSDETNDKQYKTKETTEDTDFNSLFLSGIMTGMAGTVDAGMS